MENSKITSGRKEYLIEKIKKIINYIGNIQDELNLLSITEYNINEDLWGAGNRLQETIKWLETR